MTSNVPSAASVVSLAAAASTAHEVAVTDPSNVVSHRIRIVPDIGAHACTKFKPIFWDLRPTDSPVFLGRYEDHTGDAETGPPVMLINNTIAFKSAVISKKHAQLTVSSDGRFFIQDCNSSGGTYVNHLRMPPNRKAPLKDGDEIQLGLGFEEETDERLWAVKVRVEIGRGWQSTVNVFNTTAGRRVRAIATIAPGPGQAGVPNRGRDMCCICLNYIRIQQTILVTPCAHLFHYICVKDDVNEHFPGWVCPICRTYIDLKADVEDLELEGPDCDAEFEGEKEKDGAAAVSANVEEGVGSGTEEQERKRKRKG